MGKRYRIGTPEAQEYMRQYRNAPKGLSSFEPGVIASDAKEVVAFNIAKSFYQVHPEAFNLRLVEEKTGIKPEEARKRLLRMYQEKRFMLVKNSAVNVSGFALYYWAVKLREDTAPEERKDLMEWFQENDQICTGYMMEEGGDFAVWNGNHMRNLDNLIYGVLDKFRFRRCVEWVHVCPIRRLLRESSVNQFDTLPDRYRHYALTEEAEKKIAALRRGVDEKDLAILGALNRAPSGADLFDYEVLARLSGLDPKEMEKDFRHAVDEARVLIPMLYLNYASLGLKQRFYLVSLFENTPTFREDEIGDELEKDDRFVNIFEIADAHHAFLLSSYEGIEDGEGIRRKLLSYGEVKEVLLATSPRQFRRWTCRLDERLYEECVFTDDVLLDRSEEASHEDQ